MPDNPLPPIPYKSPVVDANGNMSKAFSAFIREMYVRMGGTEASNNTDIQASIDDLNTNLAALRSDLSQGRQL
jgi:hypothetical protein